MKKILFINPGPFGSLTDTYYYCTILKDKYDITYIGFDEDKPTQKLDGISIIHLSGAHNILRQKYIFLRKINKLLKDNSYNFILINYFVGCSLIRLSVRNNLVLDIRTSYISSNLFKRHVFNSLIRFEAAFFKNISIISESLAKFLHFDSEPHILPLGAPTLPFVEKNFNTLNIIYVGTFHERNIVNTIYAFSKFISDKHDKGIARYTIIGSGSDAEIKEINEAIEFTGMNKYISYKGVIRYPELLNYLENHNVGMSYIPLTSYYDNQPPTKTFEYLLSGMAVIATETKENKKVITRINGILIKDSIDDVLGGLEYIYNNRSNLNSKVIQIESQKYSWNYIIQENLIPFIESF